ncbi:hypothetical protein BDV97DRAFT_354142 [Delphinella strobiligena]|nr:hypothetical protein BDV97DRAFT_354142 [Delphinella strobiligena]
MPSCVTLNFVMGSYKDQRLFQLVTGSSLDLNDAWRPKTSSHGTSPPLPGPRSLRTGWMLNLGDKVQSLDWLPNQGGSSQFLAVSTVTAVGNKTTEAPYDSSSSPAFTAQPPYKASIQIWEFGAGEEGRVDLKQRPRLRKVICTAWGDIRSLKWCPAPRKQQKRANAASLNLGLLAGLWGDGSVRILDISIPAPSDATCEYSLMQSAAFATRPPHTLSTCFAWLSPTGIVVGCANGSLGIWNIPSSIRQSLGGFAEPVIYASLATTYILGVVSCAPSRPHILLATTMAGHLYMIDLSDMTSNMTFSPSICIRSTRSRIGRSILAWHDWSQMVLSADDNFTLVAFPLRRFFRQVGCTRFKSSALTVAVSPVHPFILAGGVGGEVTCNNPLRRAYESKVPIWNQIWFTHEWRAQKPNERFGPATPDVEDTAMTGARPDTNGRTREDQDTGISRILEGFKSEQIKLFNTEDAFTHRENGAIYTTVYELKSSIHAVGWNPNINVGGWVAAGMSSGLLRVEDIAS